jgi:hypothetical protein
MLGSSHDSFNGANLTLLSSGASWFAESDAFADPVVFDEIDAAGLSCGSDFSLLRLSFSGLRSHPLA